MSSEKLNLLTVNHHQSNAVAEKITANHQRDLKLWLDGRSIRPQELSHDTLLREVNQNRRPSWLLRNMMSMLETKRQNKGLGWSRAWNKVDMNIFATHVLRPEADREYVQHVRQLLNELETDFPKPVIAFTDELFQDEGLMGFVFYHNRTSEGDQYEGLTVSLGRRVKEDRTKRDRLDIILEDRRSDDGGVDGCLDRVRVYVCPWDDYQDDKRHFCFHMGSEETHTHEPTKRAYAYFTSCYNEWNGDASRLWSHWSQRYINYFGPRSFIPRHSSFR